MTQPDDATDANGWPDPTRPGVPVEPERDGWHWLKTMRGIEPFPWSSDGRWVLDDDDTDCGLPDAVAGWSHYIGPALSPSEVAARDAAAYKRGGDDREGDLLAGIDRVYGKEGARDV